MIFCPASLLTGASDLCSFGHVFIFSCFPSAFSGRLTRICFFGRTRAEVAELKFV